MTRRYTLRIILVSLVLAACQSAQPAPTGTLASPTENVTTPLPAPTQPSATPSREPSVATVAPMEPASTPWPTPGPLTTTGPYLVYFEAEADPQRLVFVDADGRGQAQLPLPEGYRLEGSLASSLSPTGDRLVLYAGTAAGAESAHDLRLAVLNLETDLIESETALLSAAYPHDLQQLYVTQVAPKIGGDPADAQAFQEDIGSYYLTEWDWSPNGRYLAYAGQIDGPSTDLYLLDTQTGQRRRLTDGLEQVVSLSWSPDGRRILNGSSNEFGQGMPTHYWSAEVASDTNVDLGSAAAGSASWLGATQVLIHANVNGVYGQKAVRLVDATTGAATVIWPGWYGSLSLDLEAQTAEVIGCPPDYTSEADCGVFTIDLSGGAVTRTGDAPPYEATGHPMADPDVRRLRDEAGNTLTVAPDHVAIEAATGAMILPIGNREIWEAAVAFALAPDQTVAFLKGEQLLWALDLQTGDARLVAQALQDAAVDGSYAGWAAWVPRAPQRLTGAVAAAPQPSEDGGIHLKFLLGYSAQGYVDEPLRVYNAATGTERVLPLPLLSQPTWKWYADLSPRRDYLVYYPSDWAALPQWSDLETSDYQLWIQDLRTGAFVQRIDLLSNAAVALIAETPLRSPEDVPEVPVLGVARSRSQTQAWSPDGRYLAFTAATDGPNADLYVFDAQTQVVTRLTWEMFSLGLPFWSPDSTRIVVRELLDYEAYGDNCDFCSPGQTLAVGLDGSLARLTDDLAIHLAGWSSPDSFLTFAMPFESAFRYLAEADLQAGTVSDVVPGGFGYAAVSATTGDVWIRYLSDGFYRNFDVADGLYHLNRESRVLDPVHLGAEWSGSMDYVPQWEAFAITNDRPASDDPVTLTIMEPDGTIRFRVAALDATSLRDMNYRWLKVRSLESGWILLDSTGARVATLGAGCTTWLPNGEGVLFVPQRDPTEAQVLRAANGWRSEPVTVPSDLCGKGIVLSIE